MSNLIAINFIFILYLFSFTSICCFFPFQYILYYEHCFHYIHLCTLHQHDTLHYQTHKLSVCSSRSDSDSNSFTEQYPIYFHYHAPRRDFRGRRIFAFSIIIAKLKGNISIKKLKRINFLYIFSQHYY